MKNYLGGLLFAVMMLKLTLVIGSVIVMVYIGITYNIDVVGIASKVISEKAAAAELQVWQLVGLKLAQMVVECSLMLYGFKMMVGA